MIGGLSLWDLMTLYCAVGSVTVAISSTLRAGLSGLFFMAAVFTGVILSIAFTGIVRVFGDRLTRHMNVKIDNQVELSRRDIYLLKGLYVFMFVWAFVSAFLIFLIMKQVTRLLS